MSKKRKVHQYGNSFAVVIDKQLCRLLRIDQTTELDMFVDEDRIILRPLSRADRTGLPERFNVWKLIQALEQNYGFTAEQFDAVKDGRDQWALFKHAVSINGYVNPVTVGRMALCLERRRELRRCGATESWAATIDRTVRDVPSRNAQPRRVSEDAA